MKNKEYQINTHDASITYKNKIIMKLNETLLAHKNMDTAHVEQILLEHVNRLHIEDAMSNITDPVELRALYAEWVKSQFRLQDLWGFERNPNRHRWWSVPGCDCPKMDNEDRYGSNMFIMSSKCVIHGMYGKAPSYIVIDEVVE